MVNPVDALAVIRWYYLIVRTTQAIVNLILEEPLDFVLRFYYVLVIVNALIYLTWRIYNGY
jgi:hypothetical protein